MGILTLHSIKEFPVLATGFSCRRTLPRIQKDSWSSLSKFKSRSNLLAHVYHLRLHHQQNRFAPGMDNFARQNCRRVTGAAQLLQSDNAQLLQHKAHKNCPLLPCPLTLGPAAFLIHHLVNAISFGGVLLLWLTKRLN